MSAHFKQNPCRYTTSNFRVLEVNHPQAVVSDLAIENGYIATYFDIGAFERCIAPTVFAAQ